MTSKICSRCKVEKDREVGFGRDSRSKDTYMGICKACKVLDERKRREDPEHRKDSNERRMKWHYENYTMKRYGLSNVEFEAMVAKQGGVCAICNSGDPGRSGKHSGSRWNVDHCHSTGRVRGLLCHKCNVSLGHYERLEKEVGLEKITRYLNLKENQNA